MSRPASVSLLFGLLAFVGGCTAAPVEPASEPALELVPIASVQDVMLSVIDPSADAVWDSVATVISADGVEERRPSTDEDWAEMRIHAVRLAEASNLLLMEGRLIARPGFKSEFPGVELEPEEIQALVTGDPATWREGAQGLREVGVTLLNAVEARDADALFDAGEALDQRCESCHQHYWYPNG
jgi:hypothetical protein